MAGGGGIHTRYLLRTAQGSGEMEEVFRFRYEHFFHSFPDGYPGLDRSRHRICGPHDEGSIHYCAFDADGRLCAVCTSTPALTPGLPPAWQEWFQLGRFAPLGLERVFISTRMVIHPDHRGHGLFGRFYRFMVVHSLEAGFEYAVHYCAPGLIYRYEHHGHRVYAEPFTIPPGLLRVPMLLVLNDAEHLRRVGSPAAELCPTRSPGSQAALQAALPELTTLCNFRLLAPTERLSYVLARIGTDRLPEAAEVLPVLEYASPLRLRAGLAHTAPPGGGFFCLVLSGSLWEEGAERAAGTGTFVGTGLLTDPSAPQPSFSVPTETELLVFDQHLIHAAAKTGPAPHVLSPWHTLHLAARRLLASHHGSTR